MNMKRLLVAVVGWLALAGVAEAALVAHWNLDDNAASTAVVATTGSNATLTGGDNTSVVHSTDAPAGGGITSSFLLNGTDDWVDFSASSITWTAGAARSLSFWFKDSATPSSHYIFGHDTGGQWFIQLSSNTVVAVRGTSTTRSYTVAAMGTTWHHLLVTKNTSNAVRVFLDGTESSTGSQTISETSPMNKIGGASIFFTAARFARVKVFDSDESANAAALYAEATASGSTVRRQAVVVGSLAHPYQPTDIDWRCNPFAAFFGALAP